MVEVRERATTPQATPGTPPPRSASGQMTSTPQTFSRSLARVHQVPESRMVRSALVLAVLSCYVHCVWRVCVRVHVRWSLGQGA